MADKMGLLLTVEGFAEYKNAALAVQRLNDGVAASMIDVEQASDPAQMGVKELTTAFIAGNIAAGLITKGLNMVVAGAKKLIIGSTMLAARVDVLGTVLETVGGNAGYTSEELDKLEAAVKANGITTQAARQSLIQMAQAEIDLAHATDLSRVAQNAAVIAGIDSSQAFQRLVVAIQRGSPLMLRTLGINVSFQQSYEATAKSLNKNVKELNAAEKVQSRVNAVMQAGAQISGSYADAMSKAGKQMTSLPRYLEEIQLALGEAFQPAFTTIIFELKERLGELLEFLQDPATKKALDDFGEGLDKILKLMIEIGDKAEQTAPKVVKFFRVIAIAISDIVWPLGTAIQTVDNLEAAAAQFFAMFWGATVATVEGLKQIILEVINLGDVFVKIGDVQRAMWARDPAWVARSVEALTRSKEAFWDWSEGAEEAVNRAFAEGTAAAGRFFGVLEEGAVGPMNVWDTALGRARAQAMRAKGAVEELGEAVVELSDDMTKASAALAALRLRLQRAFADRMIAQERRIIKEAIKAARAREDIARRNAEAIADAYRRAEEARADLATDAAEAVADFERDAAKDRKKIDLDYARTRLDIERDLRRRLEDIQRNFEFALLDAARTRDAFALVMAQRRAAREREEALKGRDRQLVDAKTDYDQQRADLQESLAEQRADLQRSLTERQADIERQLQKALQAAEEQRRKDLANLARRDARERAMAALQAQWEEEDRRRRLARQLEDIERQYGVLLGVTAEGLSAQIEEWAAAYGPEGAATRMVRNFADLAEREAERVRLATVGMANAWLDAIRRMSQVSPIGIPLPEEFQFQSPKLKLETGLRSLEKYLKTSPLTVMPGGAMPATTRASTFSRSESFSKTEHDVNMNMPGNLDIVVQRQLVGTLTQVLKG